MDSRRFDPFYRPGSLRNIGGGGRGDTQLYDPESPRDSPSPESFRLSDGKIRNPGNSRLSSGYGLQSYEGESVYPRSYSHSQHAMKMLSTSPPPGNHYPPPPSFPTSASWAELRNQPPPALRQQTFHQREPPSPPTPPSSRPHHQTSDPFENFGDMDSSGSRSRSRSWSPHDGSRGHGFLQGDALETSGVPSPPPPPSFSKENVTNEEANPLSMLLENKNVSLSSLLEAALEPSGNKTVVEDPALKKKVLLSCQTTIAMLYRSRVSGLGSFVPQPIKPVSVEAHDDSNPLLLQHPRLEFNAFSCDDSWTCPSVSEEFKKLVTSTREYEGGEKASHSDCTAEVGMPISTVVNVKGMVTAQPPPRPVEYMSHVNTSQPFYALPPVHYPPRQVYPQMPFTQQGPVHSALPYQEEKRKSSSEKERKEKKKKKKRARSRSRSRGRHGSRGRRRSRSRHRERSRSRGKSRGRRGSAGSRGRSRGRRSHSQSVERSQLPSNVMPREAAPWQPPQPFNQNFLPQPRPNFPQFQQQQFWGPPPCNNLPPFMVRPSPRPDWIGPPPRPVAPPWQFSVGPVPPPNPAQVARPIGPPRLAAPIPTQNYPSAVPAPVPSPLLPLGFPSSTSMTRNERVLLPVPVDFSQTPPATIVVDLTNSKSNSETEATNHHWTNEGSHSRDRDNKQSDGGGENERRRERRRERHGDWQNTREPDRFSPSGRQRDRDDWTKERAKERARDRDRDRTKDKSWMRDKGREREREKSIDKGREREKDKSRDQRRKEKRNDDRKLDGSVGDEASSKQSQEEAKTSGKDKKHSSKGTELNKTAKDSIHKDKKSGYESDLSGSHYDPSLNDKDNRDHFPKRAESVLERKETGPCVKDNVPYGNEDKSVKVVAVEEKTVPNDKDEERDAMDKKLDKRLGMIAKSIDAILKIQRDSWELRELIKGLEVRPHQNDGIYTLRNRLLCRVCVKSKDKFLKVVIPAASSRQFLKDLHTNYHDMSFNDMVDLLTDAFHEIPGPKTKLSLIMKECPACKANGPSQTSGAPFIKPPEKRSHLDSESPSGVADNRGEAKESLGDKSQSPKGKRRRRRNRPGKNQTDVIQSNEPSNKSASDLAPETNLSAPPTSGAPGSEKKRDFKSLVRQVQMSKVEFGIIINRLESNDKDNLDPSFVMKGGMLCKKCFIDGKSEIRIIIKNEQLHEMIKIVHELGPNHAPIQKTLEVFNKHFNPIENLDEVVANFISSCSVCKLK